MANYRRLPLPRTLLHLEVEASCTVLLETCSLYIVAGELYMKDLRKEKQQSAPELIQSFVLNVCALDQSRADCAFVLTAEYSVLLFLLRPDGEVEFSEICESILVEEEVDQAVLDASTIMFANEHRELLVLMTFRKVLLLTLNVPLLLQAVTTQEVQFVRGLHTFSFCLQKCLGFINANSPLDRDEEEEEKAAGTNSHSAALLANAATSFQPIVEHASIWGASLEGTYQIDALVCTGNGSWLEIIPLVKITSHDDTAGEVASEAEIALNTYWANDSREEVDTAMPPSHFFPGMCGEHGSWITAISKGGEGKLAATGDLEGGIVLWKARKVKTDVQGSQGTIISRYVFQTWFFVHAFVESAITAIYEDENNCALWVGENAGIITYVQVGLKSKRLQKVRKFCLHSAGTGPSYVQWKWKIDAETGEGRLRSLVASTGVAVECTLHDSVVLLMTATAVPSFQAGHRSIVEVCAILPELDLIVTAGAGEKALLWNFSTNRLVATIISPDLFFTCITAFDSGYVAGGNARFITGHTNGKTNEYLVKYSAPTLAEQNNEEMDESSSAADGKVLSVSLALDLLKVVDDDDEGKAAAKDGGASSIGPDSEDGGIRSAAGYFMEDRSCAQGPSLLQEEGSAKLYVAEYQNSTAYNPLPVSDILMSTLGLYYAICYAKQCVVVHSWEDNRALAQVQFDHLLMDISTMFSVEIEDVEEDSLLLVLQGPQNIKLMNALRGSILTEFDLQTGGHNIVCSTLWDLPLVGTDGNRRIVGLCAANGMEMFTFGDLAGCIKLPINETSPESISPLDNLIMGARAFDVGFSPLASIWSLRRLFLLRFHLEEGIPSVVRIQEYTVPDDKVRVVLVSALKLSINSRTHRALVVLSDGTVVQLSL